MRKFVLLLLFAWGALVLMRCSASEGGAGDSRGGTAGIDAAEASGGEGAGINLDSGKTGFSCGKCSADLRDVLGENCKVAKTCGPDEACANGACVADPCAVSAAAKTSYGCDFWSLNLINFPGGACYAAYVANVWPVPVKIQVEFDGKQLPVADFARIPKGQGASLSYEPFDAEKGLGAGEVAILFLSQVPGLAPPLGVPCPPGITTALTVESSIAGTGFGQAFHITTDRPVAAYQIAPYGGGTAARTYATLLLPTGAWDVNYVPVNADAKDLFPSVAMLAKDDDTKVTIKPVAPITAANGVDGTPAGQPVTYSLKRGQYVEIQEFNTELTGSAIWSDKPIAVFSGNPCIGVDACCCDNAAQQIPPVRALGHEYAAVRYRSRIPGMNESVPWRLVGAVDGTTLSYQPSAPVGAPSALSFGQIAEFRDPGPFIVSSQDAEHPFYVATYMTGGGSFGGAGDPEFVNVVPSAQYLNSYVFFTDPTYSETNLVLVRLPGPDGFHDVDLDCAGVVTGWQPLGAYEYTRVDLVTGNFDSVNGCSNGRHVMKSDVPFGVTVWGWGSTQSLSLDTTYVSYAYPAGVGVAPINSVVVK